VITSELFDDEQTEPDAKTPKRPHDQAPTLPQGARIAREFAEGC